MIGLNEIRERFLKFFESKQHYRMDSFPLVPRSDKSLLLINSGMAPLKPYFTGLEIPPSKRVATCQKCVRFLDIENVGVTTRHGTFFEMLGNFSFGDYFKEEVIPWAWEFLTRDIGLPEERLFVSVFEDDDEAYEIWNKKMNLPAEKIFRLGRDDNFWEIGVGPCGPCSEIYYDKGEKYGCGKPDCHVGCDCDRFIEVWNLVFTQFNKNEDGSYSKLSSTNIDTGMGLERIASVVQDVDTIFDVDTIAAIRDSVCSAAGITYKENLKKDISVRIITDHVRAATFLTGDGVIPSNEGRGYLLRRLLRRAARHGRLLGISSTFLTEIAETAIDVSKDAYKELADKKEHILKVIQTEETRFYDLLTGGMELLKGIVEKYRSVVKDGLAVRVSGQEAFRLFDTFGFPLDLMKEILSEEKMEIDEEGFAKEMDEQRRRARSARETTTYMGAEETVYNKLDPALSSKYAGYDIYETDSEIKAIIYETGGTHEILEQGQLLEEGTQVSVILDVTPFYAESGGQKGDKGVIETADGRIQVLDTQKAVGGKIAHIGIVAEGSVGYGKAHAYVDMQKRLDTARNHTATHLLQKALRDVLGKHVEQAGSYVSDERLRFDFTHYSAVTPKELEEVERMVNEKILEGLPVDIGEKDIDEAAKMGAMALFGEKYGKTVRVVNISGYSIELCGGTHLANTIQAGSFKIVSESGIAAGTRRIEALTGRNVMNYLNELESKLDSVCAKLKASPETVSQKLDSALEEMRERNREIERLRSKLADGLVAALMAKAGTAGSFRVIAERLDNTDMNGLRQMGDKLKDQIGSGIIFLAGTQDGAANFLVMATDDAVKSGVNAGSILKESVAVAGGTGGGRPNMAQGGAKQAAKVGEVLKKAMEIINQSIK